MYIDPVSDPAAMFTPSTWKDKAERGSWASIVLTFFLSLISKNCILESRPQDHINSSLVGENMIPVQDFECGEESNW